MDIVSHSPLRVASRVYRTPRGGHVFLVVCKATYRLAPGTSRLDAAQEEVNEDDNYWDDDPRRSLYSPCDLIPLKRGADVVLVGHAFAPSGIPVRSIRTRLCVGEIDKSIEVFNDRGFSASGELREGGRVSRVSLRYERAAGGPGTSNPVGMRLDVKDAYGALALPNLQPSGQHITGPGDVIEPVGYGPIAPTWPSRQIRIQNVAGWDASRWSQAPLPEHLDPSYFNVAPRDQEVAELRPDERVVLENLHPDHPRLVTNLPGIKPHAVVERHGMREQIALRPDTLWIDSTRGICTLVFRGRVQLVHPAEAGRVVVTMDGPAWSAATIPGPDLQAMMATPISADDPDGSDTMTIDSRADAGARPVMPFHASQAGASSAFPTDPSMTLDDAVTFTGSLPPSQDPLPFHPSAPAAKPPLPFAPPAPPPPPPVTAAPLPPAPVPPAPVFARADLPFANSWSTQPVPPAPVPPAPIFPRADLHFAPAPPAPLVPPPEVPPPAVDARHEAPPLIGPLAKPELVTPAPAPAAAPAAATAPAAAPAAATAPALPLEAYPLERCAKIAAAIARRRPFRAEILEAEELALATWTDLEKHWGDAIRAEAERGKNTLLRAWDTAYVARLEEERGPIMPAEYARLVVASERGQADRVLAEMTLPRGALLRIDRVFLTRTADDPALAGKVRAAIEAERDA